MPFAPEIVAALDTLVELCVIGVADPPDGVTCVMNKLALASGSVSSETNVPALLVESVTVFPPTTTSVSATAVGLSLIPITVISSTAISVNHPSETL